MELLFNLFEYHKKKNQLLLLFAFYCLFLLLLRAKITNSIYLFFLIWNLFLAVIPYSITLLLSSNQKPIRNKIIRYFLLVIWLAFLPNSFYIITDLVHVVKSEGNLFYLDLIIISSFAITGFVLGILSLFEFENLLNSFPINNLKPFIIPFICLLCGFGIYIGRVLRYNSWDIIGNPFQLAEDMIYGLLTTKTLLFSMHFGVFIYLSFLLKKRI